MVRLSVADVFPVPTFVKPRQLRQTWLKDVGYHEAPGYREHLGLAELDDFLEVAGPRLDFVKLLPDQIINSGRKWMERKIATYQEHQVVPYLDHTYFLTAHAHAAVEQAIVLGRELGVRTIEFMNTGDDVPAERWRAWRALAAENDMQFIFEFHPPHHWNAAATVRPSDADEILRAAAPFLEAGAIKVMIDHDEFDLMGQAAERELTRLTEELSLEMLVFEVASPKDGEEKWREHLASYLRLFGPDCNVANLMPSQVMHVEPQRQQAASKRG